MIIARCPVRAFQPADSTGTGVAERVVVYQVDIEGRVGGDECRGQTLGTQPTRIVVVFPCGKSSSVRLPRGRDEREFDGAPRFFGCPRARQPRRQSEWRVELDAWESPVVIVARCEVGADRRSLKVPEFRESVLRIGRSARLKLSATGVEFAGAGFEWEGPDSTLRYTAISKPNPMSSLASCAPDELGEERELKCAAKADATTEFQRPTFVSVYAEDGRLSLRRVRLREPVADGVTHVPVPMERERVRLVFVPDEPVRTECFARVPKSADIVQYE
jgi:hypothetical protein